MEKIFLDLNGDITTGIVTIPYRGMKDHKVTYYFLDVPGEEYGQMYKGQLKNKDGSYSFSDSLMEFVWKTTFITTVKIGSMRMKTGS